MTYSVLIEFKAEYPCSGFEHIYGADSLAEQLSESLSAMANLVVVTQDLWNDFGWLIEMEFAEVLFTLYFAKYGPDEKWQLTIEPNVKTSFISRILGKKQATFVEELKVVSLCIEDYLCTDKDVCELKFTTTKKNADWVNSIGDLEW